MRIAFERFTKGILMAEQDISHKRIVHMPHSDKGTKVTYVHRARWLRAELEGIPPSKRSASACVERF